MKVSDLDNPLMFVIAMTMVIATLMYVSGWAFTRLGWPGPAQIVKGYGVA